MRTNLASVVSRQLPEFIREDYPTFVAFVEAYYSWLKEQQIDLKDSRDLDETLDEYILNFKKELAVHLPVILEDERKVLPRIKDLYLAKGSESSYKLLFRLMFGKNVELTYPGQQMLKASDGNWNQEISVFAKIDYGTPEMVVGRLVDIVTAGRVIRVLVDKKETLQGEVDRIVALGGNIYEFYLDKRFFGVINVGDKIKYKDLFQAEILPATQKPVIQQAGRNFRIGQVFEINSGGGTGALIKVTDVTDTNGIKYAELIKFGVGYTSDFGISLLSSNSINSTVSETATSSTSIAGNNLEIRDRTLGFDEQGYINMGDYITPDYVDGTYAGTIVREFALNYKNAQTNAEDPAQIAIKLGALVRYPGYYTSNNGFLDDSIKLQDSLYYQKFSYVVRIDERLDTYKAAVKSLLHPAGMALFGEYNITNRFDLSVALECVVKSLGITIEDSVDNVVDDIFYWNLTKPLTDSVVPTEAAPVFVFSKPLNNHYLYGGVTQDTNTLTMLDNDLKHVFTKGLANHYLYGGSVLDNTNVAPLDDNITFSSAKALGSQYLFGNGTLENTSITPTDSVTLRELNKALGAQTLFDGVSLEDSAVIPSGEPYFSVYKYLEDPTVGTITNAGKVWMNSYQAQDFYSEEYSEGLMASFTE